VRSPLIRWSESAFAGPALGVNGKASTFDPIASTDRGDPESRAGIGASPRLGFDVFVRDATETMAAAATPQGTIEAPRCDSQTDLLLYAKVQYRRKCCPPALAALRRMGMGRIAEFCAGNNRPGEPREAVQP
jgi:hypothetical protein